MTPSQPRYLGETAAAQLAGISARTLQRMRQVGAGIPYVRISARRLVYNTADIEKWAAERTFNSRAAELAQQDIT